MKTANKFSYFVVPMIAVLTIFAAILCVANHPRLSTSHAIVASEGGPIVACRPGNPNCDPNTNLREMASEGGPIVACRPGNPNCDPNTNLREMASEGGPIVACRPGNPNCDPNGNLRTFINSTTDAIRPAA